MKVNFYIVVIALLFSLPELHAQTEKKVRFFGNARSLFYGDKLTQSTEEADTVTVPRLNSGHVLADLGINIRPNDQTEIIGMVRIRNDYGGFWGSGVTFDIRQLSVKGVIGGIVRYQLGDINYRMSKYTMWNYDQEMISQMPAIFQQQTDVVNYDHFYFNDHSRRQQGAAAECALVFRKYIQEIQLHAVTTRVKTSNFSDMGDRLFTGLNAQVVQSRFLELGVNYAGLYDVPGTARTSYQFRNPVLTATALVKIPLKTFDVQMEAEAGRSETRFKSNPAAPSWDGKFLNTTFSAFHSKSGFRLSYNPTYTSSGFRSPGAQTKRIQFSALPDAYSRITNEQIVRQPVMLDYMRETGFYELQLQPYLMPFNPAWDNITPYGDATPNRQGWTAKVEYAKEKSPLAASFAHSNLMEVRGEGTTEPRRFKRYQAQADAHINRFFSGWKKDLHLSVHYRNDQTTRTGDERVRSVDLKTEVLGIGMEMEVLKAFDLLFGVQQVIYDGFDYTAMRDEFSEIYNFSEYQISGDDKMLAYGARYRFNENAFLSAQILQNNVHSFGTEEMKYKIHQFMLLFNMKF